MATADPRKHYGNPGNRLSDDTKRRIVELAKQPGATRNGIARELGVSAASVSGVCKRAGVTFDRTKVAAATEARKVDLAARRAQLAEGLLDDVERMRSQLFAPVKVFNIGGKDNVYTEHELEEQPVEGKLKLMQAIGAAVDRHLKLDAHDADDGSNLTAVDAFLKGMTG